MLPGRHETRRELVRALLPAWWTVGSEDKDQDEISHTGKDCTSGDSTDRKLNCAESFREVIFSRRNQLIKVIGRIKQKKEVIKLDCIPD